MLTAAVESVGVDACAVRALQALAQLDVENLEAQAAGGFAIFGGLGKAQTVTANFRVNTRLG